MSRGTTKIDSSGLKGENRRDKFLSLWVKLENGFVKIAKLFMYFGAFSLFLLMAIMTAYVVSRKIGSPLPGAFYLSQELMVLVFCLPLAAVTLNRQHVVFELIGSFVSQRVKRWLQLMVYIISIIFFSAMSYGSVKLSIASITSGEFQPGVVDVMIWPYRIILAISLIVFSISLVFAGVKCFRGETPKYF